MPQDTALTVGYQYHGSVGSTENWCKGLHHAWDYPPPLTCLYIMVPMRLTSQRSGIRFNLFRGIGNDKCALIS